MNKFRVNRPDGMGWHVPLDEGIMKDMQTPMMLSLRVSRVFAGHGWTLFVRRLPVTWGSSQWHQPISAKHLFLVFVILISLPYLFSAPDVRAAISSIKTSSQTTISTHRKDLAALVMGKNCCSGPPIAESDTVDDCCTEPETPPPCADGCCDGGSCDDASEADSEKGLRPGCCSSQGKCCDGASASIEGHVGNI